jgi:membrane protease YdiL (CAAX protease family)/tRNA A-37 threonylcarbamoyl transferase component Bud32
MQKTGILTEKNLIQNERRLSMWEAALPILLFLTVGVWGASVTAMWIMAAAHHLGGAIGSYLVDVGPERVMRRCLMGWAALFILVLLRRGGWRGWRDCGFASPDPGEPARLWWGQVLLGISLGLITLGGLSLLTLLLDLRSVTTVVTLEEGIREALDFIGSGITVALIEETVCRGMLFRIFARSWRVWPVAILTSMLFALAHFLSPDPQVFQDAPFLLTSINVFVSTYVNCFQTPAGLLVFCNLTLLGIVFCGFVVRTRTIWLAIGAHAAWVWVVKIFTFWTSAVPDVRPTLWLGARSDFMDSIAVTCLMVLLIAWSFSRSRWEGKGLYVRGIPWQVFPSERDAVRDWLCRYYDGGVLREGIVLKDDGGGKVMAQAERILKSYWPKEGWLGIRFAFRRSRAKRAFMLGQELLALGIPTPLPLAWTSRRRFGLLRIESVVITEAIRAEMLTNWLVRNVRDPALRARVMAAYGSLAAMFHQAGYSNRDLKPENVMCSVLEPWQLQVIDLDGVRHPRFIFRRRARRDLMRVGKSLASNGWSAAADVRAFFEAYNAGVPARLRRHEFPLD